MSDTPDHSRDLIILERIEQNPDATQASLAAQLGVAVGTVNWHLKRLVAKGYVKVRRVERRKLRYIITPDGLTLRARLTVEYIQNQFHLYRMIRTRMRSVLDDLEKMGAEQIRLEGDGDVAEVCKLTCLENGVSIVDDRSAPLVVIHGLKVFIAPEEQEQ